MSSLTFVYSNSNSSYSWLIFGSSIQLFIWLLFSVLFCFTFKNGISAPEWRDDFMSTQRDQHTITLRNIETRQDLNLYKLKWNIKIKSGSNQVLTHPTPNKKDHLMVIDSMSSDSVASLFFGKLFFAWRQFIVYLDAQTFLIHASGVSN